MSNWNMEYGINVNDLVILYSTYFFHRVDPRGLASCVWLVNAVLEQLALIAPADQFRFNRPLTRSCGDDLLIGHHLEHVEGVHVISDYKHMSHSFARILLTYGSMEFDPEACGAGSNNNYDNYDVCLSILLN